VRKVEFLLEAFGNEPIKLAAPIERPVCFKPRPRLETWSRPTNDIVWERL
jgi:hypothetical protein